MDNFYECYITNADKFVPIIQSDIEYQIYPAVYCSKNPIPNEECIRIKVTYDNWKMIDNDKIAIIYDYVLGNEFLFFDNEIINPVQNQSGCIVNHIFKRCVLSLPDPFGVDHQDSFCPEAIRDSVLKR